MITTVLLDLDGVVRHFDAEHVGRVEAKHGLAPGALQATAFAERTLLPAITGHITRAQWVANIGHLVGNLDAAEEWLGQRATVDPAMVKLIDSLRASGTTVAVLTNGTSATADELDQAGLSAHLDAVFNSAEIGYAKPDPRVYQSVCEQLDVEPGQVFFTDDKQANVDAAIGYGMQAQHFTSAQQLRELLLEGG